MSRFERKLAAKAQWVSRWEVSSETSDRKYIVGRKGDGTWGCSCAAWRFAKAPRPDCKHIIRIQQSVIEERINQRRPVWPTPTIDNSPRESIRLPEPGDPNFERDIRAYNKETMRLARSEQGARSRQVALAGQRFRPRPAKIEPKPEPPKPKLKLTGTRRAISLED